MQELASSAVLVFEALVLIAMFSPSSALAQDDRAYQEYLRQYNNYSDWYYNRRNRFYFDEDWPVTFRASTAGAGWGWGFGEDSRFEVHVEGTVGLRLRKEFRHRTFLLLIPEIGYTGILDMEDYSHITWDSDEARYHDEHYGRAGLRVGIGNTYLEATAEASLILGMGPQGEFAGGAMITLNGWLMKGVLGVEVAYVWRIESGSAESYHSIRVGGSIDLIWIIGFFITQGDLAGL